jgi:hypothetical protein
MMCGHDATGGRESLRFAGEVERSFSWLERLGFRISEKTETLVRYQASTVEVMIYHGQSSFEIGVEIGPRSSADRFSMSELIRIKDPELAKQYRNPAATSPAAVSRFAKEQSVRFQQYGDLALHGDESVWDLLKGARITWSHEYASAASRSNTLLKAREAFRSRAFPEVVSLLEPLEGQLSIAEHRMLDIARRKSATKPT